MKTAISIPDDVFADADDLAKTLGKSRSELYSRAVREYVARHTADQVTEALDVFCAEAEPASSLYATTVAQHTLRNTAW